MLAIADLKLVGMGLGYIVLTTAYYGNLYNGRDILWMSNSLFNNNGTRYNQTAVLTPDYQLNYTAVATVGLPRYTTTYTISQLCYNLSLGAAITHVLLYNWKDLVTGMCTRFENVASRLILGQHSAISGICLRTRRILTTRTTRSCSSTRRCQCGGTPYSSLPHWPSVSAAAYVRR